MRTILLSFGVLFCCAAARAGNEKPDPQALYIRAHYTKYDYRIPMRDGVKLFTSVYVPKDYTQKYPILLKRTPYSIEPYGIDNYPRKLGPADSFVKEGFIFAYQDVRGRFLSEGTFIEIPPHKAHLNGPADTDESTDTYDTIDWLVKNAPANNGSVGIWGVSYDGFFAAFSLINAHPALKAVSPQAPVADIGNGDDAYHNGAFYLAANFGFYTFFKPRTEGPERPGRFRGFDYGTPDEYDFYLRMGPLANSDERYLKHENPYWDAELAHTRYDKYLRGWLRRGDLERRLWGEYTDADLAPLRSQLTSARGWSKIVDVAESGEHTEVYARKEGAKILGMALIAGEKRELTVVYVDGPIDFKQLSELVNISFNWDLGSAGKK